MYVNDRISELKTFVKRNNGTTDDFDVAEESL